MDVKVIPFCLFRVPSFKPSAQLGHGQAGEIQGSASSQPAPRGRTRRGRREGGRPRDPLKGKPSLFSLFSPDCAGLRKSQSYPLCLSHSSHVFPFLRCLSLSYSPINTGKTLPHLFFSPHFRHRPLTSSIARPPCFRFPSSYNYAFCSFLILRGLYRTFQLLHAKSPPLSKTFVTLQAMTSPE